MTSRVPDQPVSVPVLQPTPVAWTVTVCAPGATGDQGLAKNLKRLKIADFAVVTSLQELLDVVRARR